MPPWSDSARPFAGCNTFKDDSQRKYCVFVTMNLATGRPVPDFPVVAAEPVKPPAMQKPPPETSKTDRSIFQLIKYDLYDTASIR